MSSFAGTALRGTQEEQARRSTRQYCIGRVAVLGAGTMKAQIAAHIANAGLPVLLLDLVPDSGDRNGLAMTALANLKKGSPQKTDYIVR